MYRHAEILLCGETDRVRLGRLHERCGAGVGFEERPDGAVAYGAQQGEEAFAGAGGEEGG